MPAHNDLTFFTNEPDRNLYERFNNILKSNTQFFDILVGYFRTSGFYLMYPAMKDIEKIRILVGINVDASTVKIIDQGNEQKTIFDMTFKKIKKEFSNDIIDDLVNSDDKYDIEKGAKILLEWLNCGKIEMKVYPDSPIHAKVYIMRKNMDKVPDQFGSVITGSSNFSKAGLVNNLEFNVELKDSRDVEFALEKFEELWDKSIPITDEFIDTVNKKTWIRDDITPYELFLKTLYEYFKEEINEDKNNDWEERMPDGFMKLQYQTDAVTQAKRILDTYNGVFISDVVGLGKTFICALLSQRLNGRKLVICPPVLKDYWNRTLEQFDVSAKVESLGKLDSIIEDEDLMKNIKYVFIDEAHRFRNQGTETFSKLHRICYGKKVILVTATPQNNYSSDIANQIYLFQDRKNSTIIPNQKNIELFFNKLKNSLSKQVKGSKEYTEVLKRNSEIIRDKVLRNVMIRRTRNEISEYYKNDIERQGLSFPKLGAPNKIVYCYENNIEETFNYTIECIKTLSYARYRPLTYLKVVPKEIASLIISQRNMEGFMKSILVKRLESSFYAFKKTLGRFIDSTERFLEMCINGDVYISKNVNVYDLLDNGYDEKLFQLVEEDEVQHYKIDLFEDNLIELIRKDMENLKILEEKWNSISEDPKREEMINELSNNDKLINKKIILFTESTETALYVGEYLSHIYKDKVLVYHGQATSTIRHEIEANYNPNYNGEKKDDIQYLVTTDVLAEGINLHRASVIINYDLPWNPTKVMQRVGRINRVGTEHKEIYIFNSFPASQANMHLTLEENIKLKIQAFHDTLGEDFKYLSDAEIVSSHSLYTVLNSKDSLEAEENEGESELMYLKIIRDVRDNSEELYDILKALPQKMKSCKEYKKFTSNHTLSFIRQGSVKKFFLGNDDDSKELYFLEAMRYLNATPDTELLKIQKDYYVQLRLNKLAFDVSMVEDIEPEVKKSTGNKNELTIIKLLKAIRGIKKFTDVEDTCIEKLIEVFQEGVIPSKVSKDIIKETKGITDPFKIYNIISGFVPDIYLNNDKGASKKKITGRRFVILSEYLRSEVQ